MEKARLRRAQGGFDALAVGYVDIHAAVADGHPVGIANDPAAAEDPAHLPIRTNDPVFAFVVVLALCQGVLEAADHASLIVGVTKGAERFDRYRLGRGLEAHEAKELRPCADDARRQFDVPDADAGRSLRELEKFVAPKHGA